MPKVPPHKPREVLRKLKKKGFHVDHHTGSHAILYKKGHPVPVSVPIHNKDLKPGTLHAIIKQAGLTPEGFLRIK